MKKVKKYISLLLAVILICCSVPSFSVAALTDNDTANDYQFVASNSIGKILSSALEEETPGDSESYISNVTVAGNIANVELNTMVTSTVVVGVYDEDSSELLYLGTANAEPEYNMVEVIIETETIPDFYLIKVFLLNETHEALCQPFVCQDYTKAYQEFLQKTTSDFEEELVVNFDDSEESNFAVLKDGAVTVAETEKNILESADEEQGVYTFSNIDENVSSLSVGDVLSYESDDGVIVLQVGTINFDGDTATITESDAGISDIFSYVKLDETTIPEETIMQDGAGDEGVTFLGAAEDSPVTYAQPRLANIENEATTFYEYAINYKFNDYTKVTGAVKLSVKLETQIYYDVKLFGKDYIEAKFISTLSSESSVKFSGELKLDDEKIHLFNGKIPVCTGLDVQLKIAPVLEASAEISINVSASAKAGFIYCSGTGLTKINEKSSDAELSLENKITVKVGLKVEIGAVAIKVITLSVEASFGAVAEGAVVGPSFSTGGLEHDCTVCVDGQIYAFLEVEPALKVLQDSKFEWIPVSFSAEFKTKVGDFYFSVEHMEFGWGDCPYQSFSGALQKKGEIRNISQGHVFHTSFSPQETIRMDSWSQYALKMDIKMSQSFGFTTSEWMQYIRNGFLNIIDTKGIRLSKGFQPIQCMVGEVGQDKWMEMYIPLADVRIYEYGVAYMATTNYGIRELSFGFYNDTGFIGGDNYSGVTVLIQNAEIVDLGTMSLSATEYMTRTLSTTAQVLDGDTSDVSIDNVEVSGEVAFNHAVIGEEYVLLVLADQDQGVTAENLLLIDQCTAQGETVTFSYTVGADGDAYTVLLVGDCNHEITSYVDSQPTCTLVGTTIYSCGYCSDQYSQEIPATGHNFGDYVIDKEPAEASPGVISRHCLTCDSTTDIMALPYLKFSGASLTLYNDLTINYKAKQSLFEEGGYTDPYVKFSLNGVETVVDTYKAVDDTYVFDFVDIIPHQLNDTIYATLYATYNGVEYASETREYSVATYCYNTLAKYNTNDYAELRTLLVDLLNYGAKSQAFMNYNTDNLVNANLTAEQAAWGTSVDRTLTTVQNREYETIDNPTVLWKGAGLNLQETVGMRLKIAADNIENLSVKVTMGNSSCKITSDAFTKASGGGYYVFFDKLNAGQMSRPVYLTVYDGDTPVSNTLCYSIESYAYTYQNDEDVKLAELVKAMMRYGDAAYAYITPDDVETPDEDENEGIGSGDSGVDPWG